MARKLLTYLWSLFSFKSTPMPCTPINDILATPTNNTLALKSGDFPSLSDALNYAGTGQTG